LTTTARIAVVFATALGSTLLGSMSGGSSSLLSAPTWVALGYPLPVAVASDKLGGMLWTVVGARNYLRDRPVDRGLLLGMTAVGVVGAVAGALMMLSFDPVRLTRPFGALILVVVLVVALRPTVTSPSPSPRLGRPAVIAAAAPLGFYEGLFGSGNSIFTSLLLAATRGFELPRALGHYYLMAAVWSGASGALYWSRGLFEPELAVPAAAGAVVGGYLGSRIGNRFGGRLFRGIFVAAGFLLGGKLLLGW
jgi:uncharacterized membrane protein YfcA